MTYQNPNEWKDEAPISPNGDHSSDEGKALHNILQALFLSGELDSSQYRELEDAKLSQAEKRAALVVRERALKRLGLSSLGDYIRAQREYRGLAKKQVARQIKMASSTLTELETGRLSFADLTPSRAVDLAEVIGLKVDLVINYLSRRSDEPWQTEAEGAFYRRQEAKDDSNSAQSPRKTHKPDKVRIVRFVNEFAQEAKQRGLN